MSLPSSSSSTWSESEAPAVRALLHRGKWDSLHAVQCSPLVPALVAAAANTELLLWDLDARAKPLLSAVRAHNRAIADLEFHPQQAPLLATCSADTMVHLWDVRDARKPFRAH